MDFLRRIISSRLAHKKASEKTDNISGEHFVDEAQFTVHVDDVDEAEALAPLVKRADHGYAKPAATRDKKKVERVS